MELSVKRKHLDSEKSKYHGMDLEKKEVELPKQREANKKRKSKSMLHNLDHYLNLAAFQNKIKEGPYFICSVCNRILYRKSVVEMKRIKYTSQDISTDKRYPSVKPAT